MDVQVAKGYIELDISSVKTASQGAIAQLKSIDRQGELTQSELNKLKAASTGVGGAFKQAEERSRELSSQLQSAKRYSETYKQEISALNTIISRSKQEQTELGSKIEKVSAQYEKSQEKVKATAEAHGKESEEYKKACDASEKYRNELLQLQNRHKYLSLEIEDAGEQTIEFKARLNNTEASITTLSRELAKAKNAAVIMGDAMQGAGAKLQGVGGALSNAGSALSMAITAPVLAAGTASVKMAMDAETSFAKVGTIADDTVLSYDKMKAGVTAASNESGVAITDFNEALYSSISAGVDSGNAINFTSDMVKLAKGGFTDTGKAVDVVTTILNAYGLEATQATAIADKLITTQNLGKMFCSAIEKSVA